jgi:hypothetical protein
MHKMGHGIREKHSGEESSDIGRPMHGDFPFVDFLEIPARARFKVSKVSEFQGF